MESPILIFDGVCGLCNRLVDFILWADDEERIVFSPMQSKEAARVLGNARISPIDIDSIVLIDCRDPGRFLENGNMADAVRSQRSPGLRI